ncbi:MAG: hypothetical protein JO125_02800 [Chloroflexi bacterium]|nr:hypothetical protein [Chloroflexota bacterium]
MWLAYLAISRSTQKRDAHSQVVGERQLFYYLQLNQHLCLTCTRGHEMCRKHPHKTIMNYKVRRLRVAGVLFALGSVALAVLIVVIIWKV